MPAEHKESVMVKTEHWDGRDRRIEDPWRDTVEMRISSIEKSVTCIRTNQDKFMETYGDVLKATLDDRARAAKLWATASEELVKKGVWAAFIFILFAVGVAAKEWIKQ